MLQTNAIDSINSLLTTLPESLQIEALHYIEYLKARRDRPAQESLEPAAQKRNGFGILKGKVTIADDFDAPLSRFGESIII